MNINRLVISGFDASLATFKKKGYVFKNPCRQSNGLMILTKGQIRYFQNGKVYMSDSNHALLIPMGANYSLECDEDSETYVINFHSPAISEDILSFHRPRELEKDAQLVISNYDKDPASYLEAIGQLYTMLSRLISEKEKKAPDIITPGIDYIMKNLFDSRLTAKAAAFEAGVSEVYFRRIFREIFGVSPLKYIQSKRIAYAKRLMSDRSLTLDSVAVKCGYASIYSFSASFKKNEGISPSRYREKHGEL